MREMLLILQCGRQQEQTRPGNFKTHCCFPLMFQDAQGRGKNNIKKADNLSKLGKDALTKI